MGPSYSGRTAASRDRRAPANASNTLPDTLPPDTGVTFPPSHR